MTEPPRVVAVTGATGGIGRATALAFAARGAKIGLVAAGLAAVGAATLARRGRR